MSPLTTRGLKEANCIGKNRDGILMKGKMPGLPASWSKLIYYWWEAAIWSVCVQRQPLGHEFSKFCCNL